jgi:hypothetical protein
LRLGLHFAKNATPWRFRLVPKASYARRHNPKDISSTHSVSKKKETQTEPPVRFGFLLCMDSLVNTMKH